MYLLSIQNHTQNII